MHDDAASVVAHGRVTCGVLLVFLVVSAAVPAHAVPGFLAAFRSQYPAVAGTRIDACDVCHRHIPELNVYGNAWQSSGGNFTAIEALDSDGDGATNLDEIRALTFPGDPADPPSTPPTPTVTRPAPTATATAGPVVCGGDCNADHSVTVDELLTAVDIALGIVGVEECRPADRNGDGAVIVGELVAAVSDALDGCPNAP